MPGNWFQGKSIPLEGCNALNPSGALNVGHIWFVFPFHLFLFAAHIVLSLSNHPNANFTVDHTMFPIPTQRLPSQRISCAPQGFPSPHVRDLLEYRHDPRCELGSRTSSSSYVLLDPSWRPQLPRQVCGEQHSSLCSHQGEKRDKNGVIKDTELDLGSRCWAEQVFGSHTHWAPELLWGFETSEVCSCSSSLSLPAAFPLVFCCIMLLSPFLTLSSWLALNSSVWFRAGQQHCEINSRL